MKCRYCLKNIRKGIIVDDKPFCDAECNALYLEAPARTHSEPVDKDEKNCSNCNHRTKNGCEYPHQDGVEELQCRKTHFRWRPKDSSTGGTKDVIQVSQQSSAVGEGRMWITKEYQFPHIAILHTHPEDFIEMIQQGGELHHLSICKEGDKYYLRPAYFLPNESTAKNLSSPEKSEKSDKEVKE